jgi:hypothetical protein
VRRRSGFLAVYRGKENPRWTTSGNARFAGEIDDAPGRGGGVMAELPPMLMVVLILGFMPAGSVVFGWFFEKTRGSLTIATCCTWAPT